MAQKQIGSVDMPMENDQTAGSPRARRHAVRFFWIVLICATTVSVAANAAHAWLNTVQAPPLLACAVATVPPLVLLMSCEAVSLMLRAHAGAATTYWRTLSVTVLLALCAFILSFDALRDLAMKAGVRPQLSWLWPIAVDATIGQATLALLSLSRPVAAVGDPGTIHAPESVQHLKQPSPPAAKDAGMRAAAMALIEDGATKQPVEVVTAVLEAHHRGDAVSKIASSVRVHHSTVSRLIEAWSGLVAGGVPGRESPVSVGVG